MENTQKADFIIQLDESQDMLNQSNNISQDATQNIPCSNQLNVSNTPGTSKANSVESQDTSAGQSASQDMSKQFKELPLIKYDDKPIVNNIEFEDDKSCQSCIETNLRLQENEREMMELNRKTQREIKRKIRDLDKKTRLLNWMIENSDFINRLPDIYIN